MWSIDEAPYDVANPIREFWPESEWDNAASISKLESDWDAFARNDTRDSEHPCGALLRTIDGLDITAELSIGYFQVNACNLPPDWEIDRLYNGRHNAGTAHKLWSDAGESWTPWLLSARQLGLA